MFHEIKEFFFHSYVEGFKHLGWQIKRNPEYEQTQQAQDEEKNIQL